MSEQNMLATEKISRLIWKFAIPGILTQVISSAHNIVDQIFIGQKFNEIGIASTNIAFPLTSIVTAVSALIGMGAAATFSILLGKGQKKDAEEVIGTGIFLLTVLGLSFTILTSVFLTPMLHLFGATELMMPYATEYVRIICLGIVFGIFSTGISYFIRADGNPAFASIVLLSGAILNMILDPLFLYGFDMGIYGIAVATVLGQFLSAALAFYYMKKKFHSVPFSFKDVIFSLPITKGIVSIGFATFVTHILMIAVQIVQMNSFRHYGALSVYGSEIVIAGAGAVSKLSIVFLSVVIGISLGCQPIYGFNLGCRQYDRVKKTYITALKYGTIVATASFLIFQLFPNQLLVIFGSDNPLFYEYTVKYIRIAMAMMFLNAMQPITSMFCSAIRKPIVAFWLAVIRQGILLIPLTLILPLFMGLNGVLLAVPISDALAACVVMITGSRIIKKLS